MVDLLKSLTGGWLVSQGGGRCKHFTCGLLRCGVFNFALAASKLTALFGHTIFPASIESCILDGFQISFLPTKYRLSVDICQLQIVVCPYDSSRPLPNTGATSAHRLNDFFDLNEKVRPNVFMDGIRESSEDSSVWRSSRCRNSIYNGILFRNALDILSGALPASSSNVLGSSLLQYVMNIVRLFIPAINVNIRDVQFLVQTTATRELIKVEINNCDLKIPRQKRFQFSSDITGFEACVQNNRFVQIDRIRAQATNAQLSIKIPREINLEATSQSIQNLLDLHFQFLDSRKDLLLYAQATSVGSINDFETGASRHHRPGKQLWQSFRTNYMLSKLYWEELLLSELTKLVPNEVARRSRLRIAFLELQPLPLLIRKAAELWVARDRLWEVVSELADAKKYDGNFHNVFQSAFKALVAKCKQGDARLFNALVLLSIDDIVSVLIRAVRNRLQIFEDALPEVFASEDKFLECVCCTTSNSPVSMRLSCEIKSIVLAADFQCCAVHAKVKSIVATNVGKSSVRSIKGDLETEEKRLGFIEMNTISVLLEKGLRRLRVQEIAGCLDVLSTANELDLSKLPRIPLHTCHDFSKNLVFFYRQMSEFVEGSVSTSLQVDSLEASFIFGAEMGRSEVMWKYPLGCKILLLSASAKATLTENKQCLLSREKLIQGKSKFSVQVSAACGWVNTLNLFETQVGQSSFGAQGFSLVDFCAGEAVSREPIFRLPFDAMFRLAHRTRPSLEGHLRSCATRSLPDDYLALPVLWLCDSVALEISGGLLNCIDMMPTLWRQTRGITVSVPVPGQLNQTCYLNGYVISDLCIVVQDKIEFTLDFQDILQLIEYFNAISSANAHTPLELSSASQQSQQTPIQRKNKIIRKLPMRFLTRKLTWFNVLQSENFLTNLAISHSVCISAACVSVNLLSLPLPHSGRTPSPLNPSAALETTRSISLQFASFQFGVDTTEDFAICFACVSLKGVLLSSWFQGKRIIVMRSIPGHACFDSALCDELWNAAIDSGEFNCTRNLSIPGMWEKDVSVNLDSSFLLGARNENFFKLDVAYKGLDIPSSPPPEEFEARLSLGITLSKSLEVFWDKGTIVSLLTCASSFQSQLDVPLLNQEIRLLKGQWPFDFVDRYQVKKEDFQSSVVLPARGPLSARVAVHVQTPIRCWLFSRGFVSYMAQFESFSAEISARADGGPLEISGNVCRLVCVDVRVPDPRVLLGPLCGHESDSTTVCFNLNLCEAKRFSLDDEILDEGSIIDVRISPTHVVFVLQDILDLWMCFSSQVLSALSVKSEMSLGCLSAKDINKFATQFLKSPLAFSLFQNCRSLTEAEHLYTILEMLTDPLLLIDENERVQQFLRSFIHGLAVFGGLQRNSALTIDSWLQSLKAGSLISKSKSTACFFDFVASVPIGSHTNGSTDAHYLLSIQSLTISNNAEFVRFSNLTFCPSKPSLSEMPTIRPSTFRNAMLCGFPEECEKRWPFELNKFGLFHFEGLVAKLFDVDPTWRPPSSVASYEFFDLISHPILGLIDAFWFVFRNMNLVYVPSEFQKLQESSSTNENAGLQNMDVAAYVLLDAETLKRNIHKPLMLSVQVWQNLARPEERIRLNFTPSALETLLSVLFRNIMGDPYSSPEVPPSPPPTLNPFDFASMLIVIHIDPVVVLLGEEVPTKRQMLQADKLQLNIRMFHHGGMIVDLALTNGRLVFSKADFAGLTSVTLSYSTAPPQDHVAPPPTGIPVRSVPFSVPRIRLLETDIFAVSKSKVRISAVSAQLSHVHALCELESILSLPEWAEVYTPAIVRGMQQPAAVVSTGDSSNSAKGASSVFALETDVTRARIQLRHLFTCFTQESLQFDFCSQSSLPPAPLQASPPSLAPSASVTSLSPAVSRNSAYASVSAPAFQICFSLSGEPDIILPSLFLQDRQVDRERQTRLEILDEFIIVVSEMLVERISAIRASVQAIFAKKPNTTPLTSRSPSSTSSLSLVTSKSKSASSMPGSTPLIQSSTWKLRLENHHACKIICTRQVFFPSGDVGGAAQADGISSRSWEAATFWTPFCNLHVNEFSMRLTTETRVREDDLLWTEDVVRSLHSHTSVGLRTSGISLLFWNFTVLRAQPFLELPSMTLQCQQSSDSPSLSISCVCGPSPILVTCTAASLAHFASVIDPHIPAPKGLMLVRNLSAMPLSLTVDAQTMKSWATKTRIALSQSLFIEPHHTQSIPMQSDGIWEFIRHHSDEISECEVGYLINVTAFARSINTKEETPQRRPLGSAHFNIHQLLGQPRLKLAILQGILTAYCEPLPFPILVFTSPEPIVRNETHFDLPLKINHCTLVLKKRTSWICPPADETNQVYICGKHLCEILADRFVSATVETDSKWFLITIETHEKKNGVFRKIIRCQNLLSVTSRLPIPFQVFLSCEEPGTNESGLVATETEFVSSIPIWGSLEFGIALYDIRGSVSLMIQEPSSAIEERSAKATADLPCTLELLDSFSENTRGFSLRLEQEEESTPQPTHTDTPRKNSLRLPLRLVVSSEFLVINTIPQFLLKHSSAQKDSILRLEIPAEGAPTGFRDADCVVCSLSLSEALHSSISVRIPSRDQSEIQYLLPCRKMVGSAIGTSIPAETETPCTGDAPSSLLLCRVIGPSIFSVSLSLRFRNTCSFPLQIESDSHQWILDSNASCERFGLRDGLVRRLCLRPMFADTTDSSTYHCDGFAAVSVGGHEWGTETKCLVMSLREAPFARSQSGPVDSLRHCIASSLPTESLQPESLQQGSYSECANGTQNGNLTSQAEVPALPMILIFAVAWHWVGGVYECQVSETVETFLKSAIESHLTEPVHVLFLNQGTRETRRLILCPAESCYILPLTQNCSETEISVRPRRGVQCTPFFLDVSSADRSYLLAARMSPLYVLGRRHIRHTAGIYPLLPFRPASVQISNLNIPGDPASTSPTILPCIDTPTLFGTSQRQRLHTIQTLLAFIPSLQFTIHIKTLSAALAIGHASSEVLTVEVNGILAKVATDQVTVVADLETGRISVSQQNAIMNQPFFDYILETTSLLKLTVAASLKKPEPSSSKVGRSNLPLHLHVFSIEPPRTVLHLDLKAVDLGILTAEHLVSVFDHSCEALSSDLLFAPNTEIDTQEFSWLETAPPPPPHLLLLSPIGKRCFYIHSSQILIDVLPFSTSPFESDLLLGRASLFGVTIPHIQKLSKWIALFGVVRNFPFELPAADLLTAEEGELLDVGKLSARISKCISPSLLKTGLSLLAHMDSLGQASDLLKASHEDSPKSGSSRFRSNVKLVVDRLLHSVNLLALHAAQASASISEDTEHKQGIAMRLFKPDKQVSFVLEGENNSRHQKSGQPKIQGWPSNEGFKGLSSLDDDSLSRESPEKPSSGISSFGITTPAIKSFRRIYASKGYYVGRRTSFRLQYPQEVLSRNHLSTKLGYKMIDAYHNEEDSIILFALPCSFVVAQVGDTIPLLISRIPWSSIVFLNAKDGKLLVRARKRSTSAARADVCTVPDMDNVLSLETPCSDTKESLIFLRKYLVKYKWFHYYSEEPYNANH
eukprot:Gregarina_sp_Poly_1__3281@NODE_193_length_11606_cov_26_333998_g172_i0_p1_GENE_NODE_193_length_11606_cov_26_333998_g172_i0NODE_193_length_11606_cov_26_333998_g172_i0_p1_ORF_typecomplete_len3552_score460_23_NODE_193_length_11606_cov_26_333998_g172_i095111561